MLSKVKIIQHLFVTVMNVFKIAISLINKSDMKQFHERTKTEKLTFQQLINC